MPKALVSIRNKDKVTVMVTISEDVDTFMHACITHI